MDPGKGKKIASVNNFSLGQELLMWYCISREWYKVQINYAFFSVRDDHIYEYLSNMAKHAMETDRWHYLSFF